MSNLRKLATGKKSNEGIFFTIKDFDGEPVLNSESKEQRLGVYGRDSSKWKTAMRDALDRVREQRRAAGKDEKGDLTPDEQESVNKAVAVAITFAAENLEWGDQTEFSKELIEEIYTEAPAIREQAEQHSIDRSNFLLDA